MNPKISILIPVYKTERYINRCLESIQKQTFQDYEVIVVDDHSPDKAMQIVEKYAQYDNRIKTIYHDSNQGLMTARKSGYKNATGDFIVFVDSDDSLPENALEILYNEIANKGFDIVISGFQFTGASNPQNNTKEFCSITGEFSPFDIFSLILKEKLRQNLWGCIFNANLFKQELVCFQNHTNGEDLILIYQLIGSSKVIKIINEITYNYHLEGESSTRGKMTELKIKQFFTTRNFKYHYLCQKSINNKLIMRSIAKDHVLLSGYKLYRKSKWKFDPEIMKNLTHLRLFRYLSLKQIINYFLFKIGIRSLD